MENALCENQHTGYYRSDDSIKHFKIRVRVRKVDNACFTASDSLHIQNPDELELVNLMKSSAFAERTFNWQEKVDRNEESHNTEEVKSIDYVTISLFTYTNSDIKSLKSVRSPTSPVSQSKQLEKLIRNVKPRPRLHFNDCETWQKPLFSNPKRIVTTENRMKDATWAIGQSMAIMAALIFEDSPIVEEIELCFMNIDDAGTFSITPDFNRSKSYMFLNSRSEIFEYDLENASGNLRSSRIAREGHFLKKIECYKKKVIETAVGTEFSMLPHDIILYSLNFEIVSAANFSAADVFVHYLITLPKGWNSDNTLEGVTETCRSKNKEKSIVAYFGYTFSLDVKTETKNITDSVNPSLKLIIEVVSVDYWGNFRSEGYGYADLILVPGINKIDISTWKVEPTTLKNKLQNFFIGGTPILDDLLYVVHPEESNELQLSKYGMQTTSSGSVTFTFSVIKQWS